MDLQNPKSDRHAIRAADMPDADLALLHAVQIPDEAHAFNYEVEGSAEPPPP